MMRGAEMHLLTPLSKVERQHWQRRNEGVSTASLLSYARGMGMHWDPFDRWTPAHSVPSHHQQDALVCSHTFPHSILNQEKRICRRMNGKIRKSLS